jgi:hypothetical protein
VGFLFPREWGRKPSKSLSKRKRKRFQSIGVPSEWEHNRTDSEITRFTKFPINLFPQRVGTRCIDRICRGIIEFPINLFPQRVGTLRPAEALALRALVSNQFISPTSGDLLNGQRLYYWIFCVSNQFISPTSGDFSEKIVYSFLLPNSTLERE